MSNLDEYFESELGNLSPETKKTLDAAVAEGKLSLTFPKESKNAIVKSTTQNDGLEYQVGIAVAELETSFKDMVKEVGDDRTDLTSITGDSRLTQDGGLDVVVLAPFSDTVASALEKFSDETAKTIEANINKDMNLDKIAEEFKIQLDTKNLNNVLGQVLGSAENTFNNLKGLVNNLQTVANDIIGSVFNGFNSFIENTIEEFLAPTRNIINSIAIQNGVKIVLDKKETTEIVKLIQSGKIRDAAVILKNKSDLTLNQAINIVKSVDNTYTKQIKKKNDEVNVDLDVNYIDLTTSQWREADTDLNDRRNFAPVVGREVYAELSNAEREITQIIFFSMPPRFETHKDIHREYARVFPLGTPFHFFVSSQGLVERGRPIEKETEFVLSESELMKKHYPLSICICIGAAPADQSSSPAQNRALTNLVKDILDAAPGVVIINDQTIGGGHFYVLNDEGNEYYTPAKSYSDPTKWLNSWYIKRPPNTNYDPSKGPLPLNYFLMDEYRS